MYHACDSPGFMRHKDEPLCYSIIKRVVDESDLYETEKPARYTTYYRAIKSRYGSLGWQARIRTGWCYR